MILNSDVCLQSVQQKWKILLTFPRQCLSWSEDTPGSWGWKSQCNLTSSTNHKLQNYLSTINRFEQCIELISVFTYTHNFKNKKGQDKIIYGKNVWIQSYRDKLSFMTVGSGGKNLTPNSNSHFPPGKKKNKNLVHSFEKHPG